MIFHENCLHNAGDNMTLTLYNVTLTSRKPCYHNNNGLIVTNKQPINEFYVVVFFNKISL